VQNLFYNSRYSHTDLNTVPRFVSSRTRTAAVGLRCESADDVDATIEKMLASTTCRCVVDFRVGQDSQCGRWCPPARATPTSIRARTSARLLRRCRMTRHTLSVLVENKPGVLARVAGLFSRRGFNIDSLAVGPTEHDDVSRMTIVVSVEDLPLEQVTKQLNKLVNVLKIVELDPRAVVQRELLLLKVRADVQTRSHVLETVQLFRAKVVDVTTDTVTVEATGTADKLDALTECWTVRIREIVQSARPSRAAAVR